LFLADSFSQREAKITSKSRQLEEGDISGNEILYVNLIYERFNPRFVVLEVRKGRWKAVTRSERCSMSGWTICKVLLWADSF
jgi:hypothetical protein